MFNDSLRLAVFKDHNNWEKINKNICNVYNFFAEKRNW